MSSTPSPVNSEVSKSHRPPRPNLPIHHPTTIRTNTTKETISMTYPTTTDPHRSTTTPPPVTRRGSNHRTPLVVATVSLVVLATACGSSNEASNPDAVSPATTQPAAAQPENTQPETTQLPSSDLDRFYEQDLTFGPCAEYALTEIDDQSFALSDEFECARMQVPLDYADPDGRTAQIAMLRAPASGEPLGSLIVNPGGPGGPGMQLSAITATVWADNPITERFDIVGFDPRGAGASTPAIECFSDEESDAGGALFTLRGAEGTWTQDDTRQLTEKCAAGSGGDDVLAHAGIRDVARDMDVLRAVLGDDQLTYAGQSYGTRLGTVYAEMFPGKVRAMMLDGAADPTMGTAERLLSQYTGFQRSFEQMAAACAAEPACPLGPDPAQATTTFQNVVRPLIDQPLPAGDGRELTYNEATAAVTSGLFESQLWPDVIAGMAELRTGRGDILLALLDAVSGRGQDGRWANFPEVNHATRCMDEQRMSPEQEVDLRRQIFETAPYLDPGTGAEGARDACEFWPGEPTLGFPYGDNIDDLPDTLTISITGDPSTPFDAGISLADTLGGSMLTVEGEQHTVAMSGTSPCVNDIVAHYLIDLETPATDARCVL
jgi:pimeloyl-ACP methyl ester carboxylesterase